MSEEDKQKLIQKIIIQKKYQSETLRVIKLFHFPKLKYFFQRFRSLIHPFSRTTYDMLYF